MIEILLGYFSTNDIITQNGYREWRKNLWLIASFAGLMESLLQELYVTFSVSPSSYRNTSGSLGEREIEVGTRARRASVSTLFPVLPNLHECFYNV